MYRIVDIDEDNREEYADYLGEDVSENIGRAYYRAIAVVDEATSMPRAGMVWTLKNINEDADTESNIVFIRSDNEDAFSYMMDDYTDRIKSDGVVRSHAFIPVKEGRQLKEMLKEAGFNMRLSESDVVLVKLSELSDMPFLQKIKKAGIPDTILPLEQVTMRSFRKGVTKCVMQGMVGLCDDLSDLDMGWFENDVSCVSIIDGAINGLLLFHQRPSGVIAIQLMVCLDQSFKKTLPYLMGRFVISMEKKYSPDVRIELDRHNQQSLLLSEKLLPRGFGIPIYAGSRTE
ncbi:hypothetical protein [Butyrivibrio sp. FCS014]|uniref:hypothetical protein n=1 Tax=Butyrivibrio sp. FCS014 TaxID=1408304 RepID=UPI000463DFD3|nr:hypothetical protein [Butyrivibrio sp. FCS014]